MSELDLRNRIRAYEDAYRYTLPPRMPIVCRLDGRSFHSLCKKFQKPFDKVLMAAMDSAALALCADINGAVIGYVQSDEITLIIIPYKKYNSEPWFKGGVQKIISTSASTATQAFNSYMEAQGPEYSFARGTFDARVFCVPREEVCNVLIDRQKDCIRNSVLSVGQFFLGKKNLHDVSCETIKERLRSSSKFLPWEGFLSEVKYGRIVMKTGETLVVPVTPRPPLTSSEEPHIRRFWEAQPAFLFEENREIIDSLVWPEDEEGQYSIPRLE